MIPNHCENSSYCLKVHLSGDCLTQNCRVWRVLSLFYISLQQGHQEGGQGGTMTPGPMDFRGPMGFRTAVGFSGPSRGPMSSRRAHQNDTEKSACEA